MQYMITGGSGFVGRHLLQQLHAQAQCTKLYVLMRDPAQWQQLDWTAALDKVTLISGDLHNSANWQSELPEQLDGIFHLAAMVAHNRREKNAVFHANVDGTLAMADLAAKKKCRFVYVSTSGTVGCFTNQTQIADENSAHIPETVASWPYYGSKLETEQQLMARQQSGADVIIFRPPIMLGPGDHRYRSTGLLLKLINKKLPMGIKGGFPFVDVRDVAAALISGMQMAQPKPAYNLPGEEWDIKRLFEEMEKLSGVPSPKLVLPGAIVLQLARLDEWLGHKIKGEPIGIVPDPVVIEMGVHYWGLRSLYAEADLNFKPRPAMETLADTVQWLSANPPPADHSH